MLHDLLFKSTVSITKVKCARAMRSMLLLQFLLEVSDKCTSFKLGLEERKYIYFLNPVKSFCMLLVPKKKSILQEIVFFCFAVIMMNK